MRTYSKGPQGKTSDCFRKLIFAVALIALMGSAGCGVTSQATNKANTSGQQSSSTDQLSASSMSLDFGDVNVGSPTSQLVSLTNTGETVVNIGKVSASGTGFSTTGAPSTALSPKRSLSIYVNFKPTAAGAASGTLSVSSDASNSVMKIALLGTGVGQNSQMHSVALSWNSSTSQVIGYFVYRSKASGGPYSKRNSSVDPSASYTDTGLTSGNYYYVITSVSPQNVESGYSNQVAVAVP